ncbi:MAG: pilus assembly protein N-terminal domain-containing protein, partial [Alphaproteobacteria bacterium]|nr:pilus assembly protein N-terminal domain-containing protein [Alphaproteobacteria bacterium]
MPPAAGGAAVPLRPGALRHAVVIEAGSGQIVALGAAAASVFAADPKVAEVRPASPTSLFVFGVAPGRTTVAALDAGGRPIGQYEVTVRPS